jgi:hypothetical protein
MAARPTTMPRYRSAQPTTERIILQPSLHSPDMAARTPHAKRPASAV